MYEHLGLLQLGDLVTSARSIAETPAASRILSGEKATPPQKKKGGGLVLENVGRNPFSAIGERIASE